VVLLAVNVILIDMGMDTFLPIAEALVAKQSKQRVA